MTKESNLLDDEKSRLIFDHLAEEVHFWQIVRDETGQIKTWRLIYVNPPTLKTWGRTSLDEIRGKTTDEIFGPGATEHYLPIVKKIIEEGQPHSFQDYFPNLDKHFHFTSVPIGEYFITTGADITDIVKVQQAILSDNLRLEQRVQKRTAQLENTVATLQQALEEAERLRQELREQAIRDPLTTLFNRRYMEESLDRELKRATRSPYGVGIIMFDIDYFKKINDRFGHEVGDVALREIGQLARSIIRGGDVACRHGGDEFLLILPEAPLHITLRKAEQLREQMKQIKWESHAKELANLTISLGVAEFPTHGVSRQELVQSADAALYRAKSSGRNQVASA